MLTGLHQFAQPTTRQCAGDHQHVGDAINLGDFADVFQAAEDRDLTEPGAFADLLAVDGNPLEDLGLFQDEGSHLAFIMKEGRFYKNSLAATEADVPADGWTIGAA